MLLVVAVAMLGITSSRPTTLADPCAFTTPTVPTLGLTPADTGARTVHDPDTYVGTDASRVQQAITAAVADEGAVVMHRFYEYSSTIQVINATAGGIMITGGGLRRAQSPTQALTADVLATDTCVSVADSTGYSGIVYIFTGASWNAQRGAFTIASTTATTVCASGQLGFTASIGQTLAMVNDLLSITPASTSGVIVDSVAFDGNSDVNTYTHDWRYNSSLVIRGANTVRNSYFYDTPAENITICGGTFTNNTAWNLGGSFVHKSCSVDGTIDTITSNRVNVANVFTDAVMDHSEGLYTLSANAGYSVFRGNKFLYGSEAVLGNWAGENGFNILGDCYSHFKALIRGSSGQAVTGVSLNAILEYVPELVK